MPDHERFRAPNGRGEHAQSRRRKAQRTAKRLIDITAAAVAMLAFSPIMAATALLVLIALGRPVTFRQTRSGYRGRPIVLTKFRTMRDDRDANGQSLSDAERLTRLGRWLRRTSLDELPQLWNVLTGELSLVGPRPLLVDYLPLYTADQQRRHEAIPGITGWAQINGRNAIGWDERFALDVWYVDNWSLWLDLKIILRTVVTVLRKEGIAAAGAATMPRFTGSAPQLAEQHIELAAQD